MLATVVALFFTTVLLVLPTAVALDAIVDLRDALLAMLAHDLARRVLVAAVTGIRSVVVRTVTGRARRIVIAIEPEVFAVIEGGRLPGVRGVAARAVLLVVAVEFIRGYVVAGRAGVPLRNGKRGVVELRGPPSAGAMAT